MKRLLYKLLTRYVHNDLKLFGFNQYLSKFELQTHIKKIMLMNF